MGIRDRVFRRKAPADINNGATPPQAASLPEARKESVVDESAIRRDMERAAKVFSSVSGISVDVSNIPIKIAVSDDQIPEIKTGGFVIDLKVSEATLEAVGKAKKAGDTEAVAALALYPGLVYASTIALQILGKAIEGGTENKYAAVSNCAKDALKSIETPEAFRGIPFEYSGYNLSVMLKSALRTLFTVKIITEGNLEGFYTDKSVLSPVLNGERSPLDIATSIRDLSVDTNVLNIHMLSPSEMQTHQDMLLTLGAGPLMSHKNTLDLFLRAMDHLIETILEGVKLASLASATSTVNEMLRTHEVLPRDAPKRAQEIFAEAAHEKCSRVANDVLMLDGAMYATAIILTGRLNDALRNPLMLIHGTAAEDKGSDVQMYA